MTTTANPERIESLALDLDRSLTESIGRIRELNDRTHVLAINARIEAARAGAAGRGFRVVAEAFGNLNLEIREISARISEDSTLTLGELLGISQELAGAVRGQRLVQLADSVMDVVDRNLYERSCDVRWWATEGALVRGLEDPDSRTAACRRLGTILDSYTVYADLVLADRNGAVVATGRPDQFPPPAQGVSGEPWFQDALGLPSDQEFGFQSVHRGPLARGQPVLVYSCPVRREGQPGGPVLGVLGVAFRWEGLGRVLLDKTAEALDGPGDLVLADAEGRVLARHGSRDFGGAIGWDGARELIRTPGAGFSVVGEGTSRSLVARGLSPGFETYSTGWSCLIRQKL